MTALFSVILILFILFSVIAYFVCISAIKPNCQPVERQIQSSLVENGYSASLAEEPFELWELRGSSGGLLKARFYPWGNNEKIILVTHGYNAPWISMLKYLPMLREFGFAVLMPDHQAQGLSEGKYITYGAIESDDGLLWLEEISRNYPQAELSVLGESMGAATALLIAEKSDKLRFCVADCPYNDMKAELTFVGKRRYPYMPMGLVMPLVDMWFKILTGCFMKDASPLYHVKKLQIPTLLVHGTADMTVPVEMSRELAKASEFITYFEAENAPHAGVIVCEPEKYREKMQEICEEVRV